MAEVNDDGNEMDEVDRAFLASLVPDECVPLGFIAGVLWLDENGEQRWRAYSQLDTPLTSHLGLLDLMKLDMLRRTPGNPLSDPEGDA